jgi:hypothetical protein
MDEGRQNQCGSKRTNNWPTVCGKGGLKREERGEEKGYHVIWI